jgi:hypothetical protein
LRRATSLRSSSTSVLSRATAPSIRHTLSRTSSNQHTMSHSTCCTCITANIASKPSFIFFDFFYFLRFSFFLSSFSFFYKRPHSVHAPQQ